MSSKASYKGEVMQYAPSRLHPDEETNDSSPPLGRLNSDLGHVVALLCMHTGGGWEDRYNSESINTWQTHGI